MCAYARMGSITFRAVEGILGENTPKAPEAVLLGMALSEFAARRAKPKEKAYILFDGDGLPLLVNPTRSKLWRLKYRHGCKEKLLSFDLYPLVSIADALKKRDEAEDLACGYGPSELKHQQKIAAVAVPIDARLMRNVIVLLGPLAKRHQKAPRFLRTWLIRGIHRQTADDGTLKEICATPLSYADRLCWQRQRGWKLHNLRAPEVECICKGKTRTGCNYLKGRDDDCANAALMDSGYNFHLLLRLFQAFLRGLIVALFNNRAGPQTA